MPAALTLAADFVLRRHPLSVLTALLVAGVATPTSTPFALLSFVPLYGVAVHRRWPLAVAAAAAVVAAVVAQPLIWGGGGGVAEVAIMTALVAAVVAAGVAVGHRRQAAGRERVLVAGQAAAEERLRIARELHDEVGHDVSLMVIQAQALGATAEDGRVREATDAMAALGRRTMGEMHRTLGALRDDDGAERSPPPSLDALDSLLDNARAAGVPVTVAVEGAPRPLAPSLDASAFRIVQEAVTNVVRHAGGAGASVTVRYLPAELELIVADEGTATTTQGTTGHGMVGMRERASLFGGTLTAGPREVRGFEVHALLPYPDNSG